MTSNPLLSPPREVSIPLYPRDIQAKLDAYDDQIEEAWTTESSTKRMGAKSAADELSAEKDALVKSVESDATRVVLRELDQRAFQRLNDEHPPRQNNRGDQQAGWNRETFPGALIRACMVSPEVTDEQYAEFVEKCPPGRWGHLFEQALEVTLGEVTLPKSSAVSTLRALRERAARLRDAAV